MYMLQDMKLKLLPGIFFRCVICTALVTVLSLYFNFIFILFLLHYVHY